MIKSRNKYIRGYLIPIFPSFERVKDITNEVKFVDEYLKSVKKTLSCFFKGGVHDATTLRKANNLFILLIYRSLSRYWEDMVNDWLEVQFGSIKCGEEIQEFTELTNKFYLLFPVDDRPGLNTSSLLIHCMATSALAICITEQKIPKEQANSLEMQCLRLASFFHEISKPLSRNNVIENSIQLFKTHFSGLYSNEILNLVEEILKGIKDENPSKLSKYVLFGSKLSLASNSLIKIVKETFKDKPEIIENFEKEDYWVQKESDIEDLTKEFLETYDRLGTPSIELNYKISGNISLLRGDVRHIHEYTDHVQKLEELRNASKVLDHVLSNVLVSKLLDNDLVYPEQIIYSSGGNIILFCAANKAKMIAQFIESTFFTQTREGLTMTTDYIYFFDEDDEKNQRFEDSFGDLYSKLAIKIGTKKNELQEKGKEIVFLGSSRLCDSCGSNMITEKIEFLNEKPKFYCNACKFKYKLEDDIDNWRNMSLQGGNYKDTYEKVHQDLMEFISGMPTEVSIELPYKLAIVNADGNLMSEFIAQSLSLSDLFSRITKVSNVVRDILDLIGNIIQKTSYDKLDYARFQMGMVYSGGDDLLFLIPSYLAIPIVLTLTKEFHKRMGRKCTLSSGIFLSPSKFPIWSAISAARRLLKNAKKLGRKCEGDEIGAIDYQSFSAGLNVPKFVTDIDSKDKRRIFSQRPFKVCVKSSPDHNEIHKLLNIIIGDKVNLNINLDEDYIELYRFINEELKLARIQSAQPSVLKDFRNKIKRIATFFTYNPETFSEEKQKALSFTMYQTERLQGLGKSSYLKLFNLLGSVPIDKTKSNKVKDFLLFDSIEILKFLSGGLK